MIAFYSHDDYIAAGIKYISEPSSEVVIEIWHSSIHFSSEQPPDDNGNQRELLSLRWLELVRAAKALLKQLIRI